MPGVKSIGVIGLGYWGPNWARIFFQHPKSELAWLCDLDEKKLEAIGAQYANARQATNYRELLRDGSLDAVVVSTTPGMHYEIAKAALEAGKHVLVEKPFVFSGKEGGELVELAANRKRVLLVGHVFLYNPAVRKLKELIDKGELGDIQYVYSQRLNLGLFRRDTNVLWDLAPHDLSIVFALLGKTPKSVRVDAKAHYRKGVADVAFLHLDFGNNLSAHLHVSWLDPAKVRKMVVVGSKKMVVFDDVETIEKIKVYDKSVDVEQGYGSYGEFQLAYKYGDVVIPKIAVDEPLKVEANDFLDCVESGKQPRSNGAEALNVVRVLEAAEQSMKEGGKLVKL